MNGVSLVTFIHLLFAVAGIAVVGVQALRRLTPPPTELSPDGTWLELVLTGGGLITAAIGPNILVIALTPGMPKMAFLTYHFLLPSLALLVLVWLLGAWLDYQRLTNRIWVGLWAGAAATGVLDLIRLTGFHLGLMPGNMPRMFGVLIMNRMPLGPSLGSDVVGYAYHYWVGACFGLTYTLLLGWSRWWGPLIWALIIEVGMMITPPMVVAMDTGYFGLKFGPGLLGTSLIAHVAYGVALGILIERYVRHKGTVFSLLRNCFSLR